MKRLYVLIDNELDPIYGAVQGGHCVAQWLLEHPTQEWNNNTLIYLTCDIEKMYHKLKINDEDFSYFIEPDLGNKITTCALLAEYNKFRNLKLLQ